MAEIHEEQGSHWEFLQILYIDGSKPISGHLN